MSVDIVTRQVSPNGAKKAIRKAFNKQRPIFLWGPPGIGKSDIIHQIAKDMEAHTIDVRLSLWEPTDIKGIPFFNSSTMTMEWAAPSELPSEGLAAKYPYVILFLDEMNSAAPAVQAAAYQLILNRRVGQYQLPDNVLIVAAGNRESDKGVTYRMPAPLANRFIHLEMRHDFDDWVQWAADNRVHRDVVGYCSYYKKDLYDFDPKSASRAFATPRSWSFVSELLVDDDCDDTTLTDLISGAVGEGLAIKFMAHKKIASKMPKPTDILNGKVKKLETTEISAQYSLIVSLCYELQDLANKKESKADVWNKSVNNFFSFILNNFEPELVIMGTKIALVQYKLPLDPDEIDCFDEFHSRYGKYVSSSQVR